MKFIKNSIITFFTNISIFAISFIISIMIARTLGTEGSGIISMVNTNISMALIILSLGVASSNVFFIGRKKEDIDQIIGINILITIISLVFIIIFYFLNVKYNFKIFKGLDNNIIILTFILIPTINLKTFLVSILQGLNNMVEFNKINIIDQILYFVILILFLIIFKTPFWAVMALLSANIIIVLVLVYLLFIKYKFRISFRFTIFRDMMKFGLKAQIANVVQRLNYDLDKYILNWYFSTGVVGIYARAVQLGQTMWKVSGSVATVVYPMTTNAKNKIEMNKFITKVTRITLYIIGTFSLILIIISKPLIYICFGEDFLPAATALIYLIPGICIFSMSNILSNYLSGIGHIGKNIIASCISCVVTVVFDLIMIPVMGMKGAAIATSLSYITFTIVIIFFYIKITSTKFCDLLILKKEDIKEIKIMFSKIRNKIIKKND